MKTGLKAIFHCSRFARAGGAGFENQSAHAGVTGFKNNERFARVGKANVNGNGLKACFPLGEIFRAEQNFSLPFLISSTREITRQREIPLRAENSA
jgi:hypothetical protein